MNAIGVIPARWASSRFEGKVLAEIDGKTIIQYVWEMAKESKLLDDLIVAADNEKVVDAVKGFGGKVSFTSPDQPSGTDRVAEVVNPIDVKIVVNIQGDEPMVRGVMVDSLITALLEDKEAQMATVIKRIENSNEIADPNVVKVVVDKKGYALYFSRNPIPYVRKQPQAVPRLGSASLTTGRSGQANRPSTSLGTGKPSLDFARDRQTEYYKHIGIYAYTKDFLFTYTNLPSSRLERAEKLEQLRALEHGFRIKTVETEFDTIGVDTPEDLERMKRILKKDTWK